MPGTHKAGEELGILSPEFMRGNRYTVPGIPAFAKSIEDMGINIQRTPKGLAPRTSPDNWTWHHAQEPGVMQLVPKTQHQPGSIFQDAFHPDGKGGYSIWGK